MWSKTTKHNNNNYKKIILPDVLGDTDIDISITVINSETLNILCQPNILEQVSPNFYVFLFALQIFRPNA